MEAYPEELVEHNLPLVLLSGLGSGPTAEESTLALNRQGGGTKILLNSPECPGDRVTSLLNQFLQLDGSGLAWNSSTLPGPTGTVKYRIRAIGRVGTE